MAPASVFGLRSVPTMQGLSKPGKWDATLSDPLYASAGIPAIATLDSNLRFFGGVWLGLGLSLYLLIPNIEKQTLLFRVLWGMIFLGGIGRLASMLFLALPPLPFIGFTVLEIIGAPFFIWW